MSTTAKQIAHGVIEITIIRDSYVEPQAIIPAQPNEYAISKDAPPPPVVTHVTGDIPAEDETTTKK